MRQPSHNGSNARPLFWEEWRGRWFRTLVRMGLFVVSIVCGSPGEFLRAQDAAAAGPATPTNSEGEESADGTFARTLTLAADREIEIRLRSAHSAFQIGNSAEGVRVLAELLTLPDSRLIETQSTYRDIHDEVVRFLRTSSQDLRDQFRRETEVRATSQLKEAIQAGDLVALRQVLTRYPLTPSAREAAQRLAEQQFDHGDFAGARQTAARWMESAPDPQAEAQLCQPLVHLWQQALLATDGPTAARELATRFGISPREPDFLFSPAIDNVASPPEHVAAPQTSWQVDSPLPPSVDAMLQEIVGSLRRNGVHPQLSSRPLVAGDQLFWRSPTELLAVRCTDGAVLWRVPSSDSVFEEVENGHARPDDNLRLRLKFQLGHRLLRDSVHGELSCDSERVYCIEQAPDQLPPLKNENAAPNDLEFRAPIPARTIVARSRTTGETLWRSHEVWDAGHQGLYIFGPPSPHKSQLFVVIQKFEQLVLVRIDPRTGKLAAEFVLGDCSAPMLDRRRLNQSVPIVWNGDQAICGTGAGAIVAVDIPSGRMSWAFRHPRHDNITQVRFLQVPTEHHSGSWYRDWRETQLLRSGERLVYATPESRQLRCLSAASGELLWEVPAEGASRIVAVDSERALVQVDHGLRSYRLTDGAIEVEHRTSSPIASASWDGTSCHLVLDSGQQQIWNPSTKQSTTLPGSVAWGQLVSPRGTQRLIQGDAVRQLRSMISLGTHQITITPQGLSTGDLLATAKLPDQLPLMDWETAPAASQVSKLIEWIEAAPAPQRPDRLRMALAESARGIEACPDGSESFERLLNEWPTGIPDQIEMNWRLLLRSVRDGRREDSVRHLLALLERDPSQWEVETDASWTEWPAERPRTVRLDAAIRGALHRLWQQSNDSQRQFIDTAMRQWASHPNAVAGRWAEPLRGLSFWNAPKAEPVPVDSLARLAATQFELLQQAARSDRTQAATALLQLAEFQLQRGDRQHAAALLARLQKLGDVPRPEGTDQLQANVGAEPVAWPDRKPIVSDAKPSFIEGDSLIPVPIRAERGSPFDRIEILCPVLPQRNVKFAMDGKLGWDSALPLSNRDLARDHALRRGWAFGQFVVLQLGSELYCIGSQKAQGTGKPTKTKEQFLWPRYLAPSMTKEPQLFVDTLGTEDNRMPPDYRPVSQYVGFTRPSTELFDPYGRRRTWVGPVTAGITCFLQQGMLVCLETSTGQELWRRYNMPAGVRCFGDEQVVGVVHDDSRQVDLLSPLDGQTLQTVRLDPDGELLHHWGRHLLIARGQPRAGMLLTPRPAGTTPPAPQPQPEPEPEDLPGGLEPPVVPTPELREAPSEPLQLSLVDLDGMKTVWSRTYPAGSAAFEVDEEWLGVLHAPEKIELLDVRTGELISETPVTRPAGLVSVSAALSDQMIYVSLSSSVTAKQLTTGYRPGWRWPLTSGPVHALDRQTGKQAWTRVIENRGLPLSQPRDVPLMVFYDAWEGLDPAQPVAPKPKEVASWSRYLFLDARTGETLHESAIRQGSWQTPHYATMDKDRKAGRVDVKLDRKKIRFDYAPKAE